MLNQRYAQAFAEVLDILRHMNANDLIKVSNKFIEFLKKNASKEYKCDLDYSKKLSEMNLKPETRRILAIMYLKYLCSEEKKNELKKKIYENEKIYQEELRKKYNPDNIFGNNKKHN